MVDKTEYETLKTEVKDLKEKVEKLSLGSEPVEVLTCNLGSSRTSTRAVGTYVASSNSSYTITQGTDFDKYLIRNDNGTWKVLKSGFYNIYSNIGGTSNSSTYTTLKNIFVFNNIEYSILMIRPYNYQQLISDSTTTMYLEKDSTIDFKSYITEQPSTWHYASFKLFALFE